jgi:hypothetical protein
VLFRSSSKHRKLFEEALGKYYDQLTNEDHEELAQYFERYLKEGTAPTEAMRSLFRRIAQVMKEVIKSFIGSSSIISPELRYAFDTLFADQKNQLFHESTAKEYSTEELEKKSE